jgi:hypothetical protein
MAKRIEEADKIYIENNCKYKTDADIAKHIGCSIKTVERYRKSIGMMKNTTKDPVVMIEQRKDYQNRDIFDFHVRSFETSPRGSRIKKQLPEEDWILFSEEWANYKIQLEDLTHTEQNTVEQLIFLKLRIDKNQKDYYDAMRIRDSLMANNDIVDVKDLDLSDPKQAELYQKIFNASMRATDLNKECKDLLEKSTKLNETLNATRRQREEKGKVGGDTFFSLCKKFESMQTREKEGRMAELLRLSMEKKQDSMRNAIEYMDGELAPQLLDSETVKKTREQQ